MANIEKTGKTGYTLDQQNRIIAVSGEWDRFARENDGLSMLADKVIGKPIWDFITGDPTTMWFDTVLSYARANGKSVSRTYRCDSPELKRFMEMSIEPQGDGNVDILHTTLEIKPNYPAINYRFLAEAQQGYTPRCSICSKIFINQQWTEASEVAPKDKERVDFNVIYTVCDGCKALLPE